MPEFQQTAALWGRGILADRHGVAPSDIRWRSGGLERPGGRERIAIEVRQEIDLRPIEPDATLSGMLADGRLDGLVSPRPPSFFEESHPKVRRLCPTPATRSGASTGTRGCSRSCTSSRSDATSASDTPGSRANVFDAFSRAKELAIWELEQTNFLRVTVPWVDLDEIRGLMGRDFWAYGLEANRAELDAVTRWSLEEGSTEHRLEPPELFHPSTVG